MTETLIIGALAVAALWFVVAPLRGPETVDTSHPSDLEDKKARALTAILDLESEHEVGKLSDEDFDVLKKTYEAQALEVLKEIDDTQANDHEDHLEREIARVRRRLSDER